MEKGEQNLLPVEFVNKLQEDEEIIAVLLYGSYARGESYRDIDICIVLDKKYDKLNMSKKRVAYSSLVDKKFDVQIFQQLPLYVRKRILKEGKVMLLKNEDALYDVAFSTIKEFEYYRKSYENYLAGMRK